MVADAEATPIEAERLHSRSLGGNRPSVALSSQRLEGHKCKSPHWPTLACGRRRGQSSSNASTGSHCECRAACGGLRSPREPMPTLCAGACWTPALLRSSRGALPTSATATEGSSERTLSRRVQQGKSRPCFSAWLLASNPARLLPRPWTCLLIWRCPVAAPTSLCVLCRERLTS